jgi:WD40 repeat protein
MARVTSLPCLVGVTALLLIGLSPAAAPPTRPEPALELCGHKKFLTRILFRPDGKQVLAVCEANRLVAWSLPAGKELFRIQIPLEEDYYTPALAYSPDGRRLAVGIRDDEKVGGPGVLSLYDTATGKRLWWVNLPKQPNAISFSPDSKVVASNAKGVRLHDAADGKYRGVLRCGPDREGALPTWSPDGKLVALPHYHGVWDEDLEVFDAATFERNKSVPCLPAKTLRVRFAEGNKELVSTHKDGTVRVWDLATGKEKSARKTFRFPAGDGLRTSTITLSPDARWVAAYDRRGVLRLSDAATGEHVWSVRPRDPEADDNGDLYCVAFSPDGRWLARAVNDWAFEVWDVDKITKKKKR